MRKIIVDNVQYDYKVGRGFTVIRNDFGFAKIVRNCDLKGITGQDFERGWWKRTQDGMILPSEVAKFIRKSIT